MAWKSHIRAVGSNFSVVSPTSYRAVCVENLGWCVVTNAIAWSTISMHSMLILQEVWGHALQENFEKHWDPLRLNLRAFRVIVMHTRLATWPNKCYSYSYRTGGLASWPLFSKLWITSTAWLWSELDLCLQNAPGFPKWPSFSRFINTTFAEC